MFANKLIGPSGPSFEDTQFDNPTWPDVESAVRQLDGNNLNYLTLFRTEEEDKKIVVAGGEEGLFFVQVEVYTPSENYGGFFYLIDLAYPDKEEEWSFLVNQSDTECFRYEMSDFKTTLQAVKTFAETGEMDSSLSWTKFGSHS